MNKPVHVAPGRGNSYLNNIDGFPCSSRQSASLNRMHFFDKKIGFFNNALEETPAGREISGVAGKFESLLSVDHNSCRIISYRRRWATNGQSCRCNHLVLLAVVDVEDLESRRTFVTSYTCI
jgi:hypothetical protein